MSSKKSNESGVASSRIYVLALSQAQRKALALRLVMIFTDADPIEGMIGLDIQDALETLEFLHRDLSRQRPHLGQLPLGLLA